MKRLSLLILSCPLILSACAFVATQPAPNSPVEDIIAEKGQPTAQYTDGNTRLLEWASSPYAQHTYMARISAKGKLISYENVRTKEKFETIQIGKFDKNMVLRTVGQPTETDDLPSIEREVWAYRYKEDDIWNAMMYIYFDSKGIVRKMENGMDPMYMQDE